MRVFFVTNICPHYRVKAFELLGRLHQTRFLFFSGGDAEKYWERNNSTAVGNFEGGYVRAWTLFSRRFRIVPGLYRTLLLGRYDVLIKCISGKIPLLVSFLIAKSRGIPFVLWTGLWHHPHTLLHQLTFPIVRWIYRTSDAIVVYGPHVRDYLTSLGVSSRKVFIAWQAVDNETLSASVDEAELRQLRSELDLQDPRIVLYVGRLERQKGLEYLMEALLIASQQVHLTFIAVGTGSYSEEMQDLLRKGGFSDTRFPGYVENENLRSFYRLADVLVLPSVTTKDFKEPWGLVVNEAMNQRCPVITTDAVGAAAGGLVLHRKTGLIVPEKDSRSLAEAIIEILSNAETQQKFADESGVEIKRWTYERMVSGFEGAVQYAYNRRGRFPAKP